jgi:hypothetical protein
MRTLSINEKPLIALGMPISISEEANLFGSHKRKKACKEAGLTGKEKRQCARDLKKSGWKKGDPIPANMGGIKETDVAEAEAEEKAGAVPADAPAEKSKAGLFIGIGVILLLIIVAAVILMRRKATAA